MGGEGGWVKGLPEEGVRRCRAGCAEPRWWGRRARPDAHLPANLSSSSQGWEISWVLTQEACQQRWGSPELLAGRGLFLIHHGEKLKHEDRRSQHIQQSQPLFGFQSPNLKRGSVEWNELDVPSSSDLLSAVHPSSLSWPQTPTSAVRTPDM